MDPRLVKLSLEPPYRDDNAKPIPNLQDIGNDGTLIFEEKQSPAAALTPQLKRLHDLIASRKREFRTVTEARVLSDGAGILDPASSITPSGTVRGGVDAASDGDESMESSDEEQEHQTSVLNPESLMQLRANMIQRLQEAQYSMNTSLDMLNCLLAVNTLSTNPQLTEGSNPTAGLMGLAPTPASQTPAALTTLAPSVLTPPPTKPSVAVVDAQIGITTRDSGIRKAAGVLRKAALSTAEEIERASKGTGFGPLQGRHDTGYWATALRLRQACWALLPAPLPSSLGPVLKGSNRTSKDVLFGFALEGSAAGHRRFAFGLIPHSDSQKPPDFDKKPAPLAFPQLHGRRLQVSLKIDGKKYSCLPEKSAEALTQPSGPRTSSVTQTLTNLMRDAQQETVELEIFSEVIGQARYSNTRVSQQSPNMVELEISQDIALLFERVPAEEDIKSAHSTTDLLEPDVMICTLIRHTLGILLTRAHRGILLDNMIHPTSVTPTNTVAATRKQIPILSPIVSLLRYRAMVQRVDSELKKVLAGLGRAGVQATLTMTGVSEPAKAFVESLSRYVDTSGDALSQPSPLRPDQSLVLSGEALLRIEGKHLIQISFQSPTLLNLRVVQAQITVHDHEQLGHFLRTDVAARVIQYIQDVGREFVAELLKSGTTDLDLSKSWFADPIVGFCIGRWPNGKGRFQVVIRENGSLQCEAAVESHGKPSNLAFDDTRGVKLKDWVCSVISLSFRLAT